MRSVILPLWKYKAMSMYYAERTGKIKLTSGLVDYAADGILHLHDTGDVPCKIGYVEVYVNNNELILQPILIFIQNDGVTKEGNHYYRKTIDLNIRRDIACQEEK